MDLDDFPLRMAYVHKDLEALLILGLEPVCLHFSKPEHYQTKAQKCSITSQYKRCQPQPFTCSTGLFYAADKGSGRTGVA